MCSSQRPVVAVEVDSYISDQDSHYWFAKLSDGTTVYEDDNRPELEEKSAWKRLKFHCETHKISIVQIGLKFRSNMVFIDTSDWSGVFFIKSLLGFIRIHKGEGPPPVKRFPNRYFYHFGRVEDGKIETQKWEMPAVIYKETYERPIGDVEKDLIIYNV